MRAARSTPTLGVCAMWVNYMTTIGRRNICGLCFLLLVTTYVHAQDHVCYVRYSFEEVQTHVRSSFFGLGEFRTSFADETVTKSFRHDESNVTVNVGVEYFRRTSGNRDAALILAIAFSGKPEDVFDEVGRVKAEASGRDPMNSTLMISKSVADANRVWTFYLSCMPKKKALHYRRHAQQIVGRERRGRVSHHNWSGDA